MVPLSSTTALPLNRRAHLSSIRPPDLPAPSRRLYLRQKSLLI
ncbi:MAG: hypothetical protein ACKO26_15335 [Planctomycetota bacterium]